MKSLFYWTRVTFLSIVAIAAGCVAFCLVVTLLLLFVPFIGTLFGQI